ncbi:SDR family NAD(P)-dependent oxidoreductase [Halorubrum sp. DTA46]|uniref:SDR family NAD(P)-dependent oxidoreductase n=1 Tax=Halorubrum sp. DTA46 TaxID=3402162 RepID=UPI003AAFCF08
MSTNNEPPVYPDLEGKTALVTGSSRNMGRAIAVALGECGANVGVTARSDSEGCEETAAAVEAAGGGATVALGDLGKPEEIRDVFEHVRETFGPIDVLVNNAAIRNSKPFEAITLEEYQHVQDVNLRSVFVASQEAAADMREQGGGSIVNILGLMALQGRRGKAHASVTKTGIIGLTKTLASELGPDGIRVNSVVPGRKIADTQNVAEKTDAELADFRKIEQATPLRRRGQSEEIANVVRFVASEQASFVTAEVWKVDGGLNTCIDLENIDTGGV